jgi:hypothetical protein
MVGNTEVVGLASTGSLSKPFPTIAVHPTWHPNTFTEVGEPAQKGCMNLLFPPAERCWVSTEEATRKGKAGHEGIGSCRM